MSNASQENSQTASEETATVVPRRCLEVVERHNRGTLSYGRAVLQLSQILGDVSGGMPPDEAEGVVASYVEKLKRGGNANREASARPEEGAEVDETDDAVDAVGKPAASNKL